MSGFTKEKHTGMTRRAWRLVAGLHILLVVALLAGCSAPKMPVSPDLNPLINQPHAFAAPIDSFPAISGRHADVPDDYEAVAENELLRLYVRRVSSAIIVEDKRTGALWRSSPADLETGPGTTNIWKRQIEIPISVAYVDAERSQPKNVRVENIEMQYQPVKDGVQTNYTFKGIDLSMAIQYTLNNDCLEAALPPDLLQEAGVNGLVSIELLPFFGAVRDGEEGYIVFPDGSGALMGYTSPHLDEVQRITTVVYGMDASGGLRGSSTYREDVVMPVFGQSRADGAFVGMITEGDFDASLSVARAGKGVPYNHVWSTFVFRRQGRFSLTGGQPAWLYQPDLLKGNRRISYCMLPEEKADYVGMATRYREFLINERGATRITDRVKGEIPWMHLAFFMGIERRTWFLSDMITMTTFEDANEILKELANEGVHNLDVTLYNWNRGGTSQRYPTRLPADERLGGADKLRTLANDIEKRGQRLFLQDNYLLTAPNAQGVTPFNDASRGVDGLPIGSSEDGFLLNPQIALRSFAARDFPVMSSYGASGLQLEMFGFLALPDKNQNYPLSRENYAGTLMQIAQLSRDTFGTVSMEGSNIYALPYADRLDFVSIDSTHFDLFDTEIPFYQIVAHGLVQYTNQPYNLISDGNRMRLRQVEYGATPFFMITKNSSAELLRTEANWNYSSQYSVWRDEIIRQYRSREALAPLTGLFITGHETLARNVKQTTYENGTRVIVNYNSFPYTVGTVQVPAMDFVVLQGD